MHQKQSITLSREELYAQVWEVPMNRLAIQYGISGNGLAKICDRLKVPYPPRGYWAKKAAGKKVVTLRLQERDSDTPENVTITPSEPATKSALPEHLTEQIAAASAEIQVSSSLVRPHSIIAGWLKHREERKQEARKERDPWRKKQLDPGELSDADNRQHRILDALFKSLESAKAKVKTGKHGTTLIEVDGEDIEIQLREKQKQIRRPLTEEEKRWSWNASRGWIQELQPSGKLAFAIKTYLPEGLKQEWSETDTKPMEKLLAEIFITLLAAGPALARRRKQREEEEKQRQIAERRRYEEQQRRKREHNRWRQFVDFANSWSEVENARAFLEELKTQEHPEGTIDGRSISEWIEWIEQCVQDRDPLIRGSEHIFGTIAAVDEWNYNN